MENKRKWVIECVVQWTFCVAGLPLVEERVAAFDGERGRVLPRHDREIGLIELTVDGAESAVKCHVVRAGDSGHWQQRRMTR